MPYGERTTLREVRSKFTQHPELFVAERRSVLDQAGTNPVLSLHALLCFRLNGNIVHSRPVDGLTDRFGIIGIIFTSDKA